MTNKAELGIEVDVASVQKAVDALNLLAEAAERASAALSKLENSQREVVMHVVGDVAEVRIAGRA
jgi:hypothetical protein